MEKKLPGRNQKARIGLRKKEDQAKKSEQAKAKKRKEPFQKLVKRYGGSAAIIAAATPNPDDIEYVFGEVYSMDEFYPSNIVSLRDPYILRDHRGQTVVFRPFQYNPESKILRVYTSLTIEVYEDDNSPQNIKH